MSRTVQISDNQQLGGGTRAAQLRGIVRRFTFPTVVIRKEDICEEVLKSALGVGILLTGAITPRDIALWNIRDVSMDTLGTLSFVGDSPTVFGIVHGSITYRVSITFRGKTTYEILEGER